VQEVKEENLRLHRELKELRRRLDVTVAENEKIKEKNCSLTNLNEGLCRHVDELQYEIRELHLEISSLKVTIEDLRQKQLCLIQEAEILEQQIVIHKKEQAILVSQIEVYQANLAESQHMWLLAVKAQHELELTIRMKSGQLARVELDKDGFDAKIKLLERQIELSSQNVAVYREAIAEWETRFECKTVEVTKLLEMWASMDKVCKVSVHGEQHWDMHHGFPKGLPGYVVAGKDPEPPKKPESGSNPPPKSRGGPPAAPAPGDKKPAAAPKMEEGRKDTKH
jgi:chromosome segregation ATPase